jgi:hypothetical protein
MERFGPKSKFINYLLGFPPVGKYDLLLDLLDGIWGARVSITGGFFRHQSHPAGQKTLSAEHTLTEPLCNQNVGGKPRITGLFPKCAPNL